MNVPPPPRCDHSIRTHKLCVALNDIMIPINLSHDFEEIFQKVMEESSKALGCESARIAMREGNKWIIRYVYNLPNDHIGRTFTDEELPHAVLAMTTRKPVDINDALHDGRTNNGMMESLGIKSVLVLPLMEKDVVTGTLMFGYHARAASFSDAELDYAERMTLGIANAIQNARLHQELEESKMLGDALSDIDTVLYSTQDYDVIMNKMLQLATDAIGAETAVIFSKEGERWVVRNEYKLPVSLLGQSFSNTEVMHTAITADTKRSLAVHDVLNSPDIDQKFVEMLGIRSLLDFPLILKGEVIGDLTFHHHSSPVPFNERQMEFVRKLQIAISLALENNRLLSTYQNSESKLKEAEKIGKFGYFNYNVETRKITWSEGVFHIFGRDPVLGEPSVKEFCEQYSVDPGYEAIQKLVGSNEISKFDAKIQHLDLTVFFRFSIRSAKDDQGDIVNFFGTVQDITDRKLAEEEIARLNVSLAARAAELESANRELGAFNYTVAHDLRTPLNTLSLSCQAIEMMCNDFLDEECKGYVRNISTSTLKMNQLIAALLTFSHMGHVEPQREKIDLSTLAQEAFTMLQQTEPERPVDFRISDRIEANGDASLLRVVLDNLLGNAWKYTVRQEKPVIEFGVKEIEGVPTYFVQDNGIGFDNADEAKLFLPFQRLPGAETSKGFGIGLATVERIIKRHGGRIWAEGEAGKGACFYFTLAAAGHTE